MNYPPQGGGQYQGGAYMPPPDPNAHAAGGRSGIPKVMGILMIIFGSLGLLASLWGLSVGGVDTGGIKELEQIKTYDTVTNLLGLLLSGLHLMAGIMSVKYKANGPKLAISYGIAAIALQVIKLVAIFVWVSPKLEGAPSAFKSAFAGLAIIGAIFMIIWPVIVLALMTRPTAKAACTN